MSEASAESVRKQFAFRREILEIIVNGRSALDAVQGFEITSVEDADRFIRSYGYDFDNSIERAEAYGNFHESLNFIRRHFLYPENLEGLRLEVPRKILEIVDIRELFLMASLNHASQTKDRQGLLLRNWACAILKVMHTVAHIDQDIRSSYFADVQQQILDRYYRLIHRDVDGGLYLSLREGDADRVPLVAFEVKPKKARDSILIKLLHKPENVAEDIFDRVGIRFVTHSRLDALRVVRFLTDHMAITSPNIKPSRSRNSLIDMKRFQEELERTLPLLQAGQISPADVEASLEEACAYVAPTISAENPHTSEHYRSLQFTVRQLIKLKNPIFDEVRELKNRVRTSQVDEEVARTIDRIDLRYVNREVRFFYPYEVQVVDQRSFEENERGRSAHSEYKRSQKNTAMRRVLGQLMEGNP